MTTCKNCGHQFEGNYCNNCGQTAQTHRLDWAFMLHSVEHSILHFDHGILYTVRQIFLKPGDTIRKFIEGQRRKFTHPITYLVIISILYFLGTDLLLPHIQNSDGGTDIAGFMRKNYLHIIIIILVPLAAIYTPIFYPNQPYNFVELFSFHCYMRAQFMLFELCVVIMNWLLSKSGISIASLYPTIITILLNVLFLAWALKDFFKEKDFWLSLSKSLGLMAMIVISSIIIARIATLIIYGNGK